MERPSGAPPFNSGSTQKRKDKWAALEPEHLTEAQQMIEKSKYYDPSGLRTRKRRRAHLEDFEFYCKEIKNLETHAQIWNRETCIDLQKEYIMGSARVSKGILESSVKAGTLYEIKYSFYWWSTRFVDGFNAIYLKWNTELNKWIHQVATELQLSRSSWEKNLLTDSELLMLYKTVAAATTGVDNSLQHYNAWLLAWGTGVRPGSMTVCPGYGRKDLLPNGAARGEDQTLRWSDVQFFKHNSQVGFRITFKYMKCSRDAYKPGFLQKSRTFLYLPLKTKQLELDMTLTLLGLAIKRDLFPGGLNYVLHTDDTWLKTDPSVLKQAVFLAADSHGTITPGEPMKSGALNPRLRTACIDAGLPQRNTMYSFRRTRIIDTKHEHGTEEARAIANHGDNTNTHEHYDVVDFGDVDIQSYILGRQTMSRREARRIFEQAAQTAYVPHENYDVTLRAEVEERLRERERVHPESIEIAQSVKATIDNTHEFLIQNSADDTPIPRGYTGKITGAYKVMLRDGNPAAGVVLKELEAVFYKRKLVLKKIRRSIRNTILEELAQEMRASLNSSSNPATTGVTTGTEGAPILMHKEPGDEQAQLDNVTDPRLSAMEALLAHNEQDETDEPYGDLEEGLAMDTLEEEEDSRNPRGEPLQWQDLPEETVRVNLGGEEDGEGKATEEERLAFLRAFIARTSQATSGLKCWLCQFDRTMPQAAKDKKWRRAQLEKHMKGKVHTRREELIRAFNELKAAGCTGSATCPLCPNRSYTTAAKWLVHVEHRHREELWLKEEAEEEEEEE